MHAYVSELPAMCLRVWETIAAFFNTCRVVAVHERGNWTLRFSCLADDMLLQARPCSSQVPLHGPAKGQTAELNYQTFLLYLQIKTKNDLVVCLTSLTLKCKDKERYCIAVNGTPSHSYGVSLAIWDHTVLPATRHKWTHTALTPARQASTRFTYPVGMEGWVDPKSGLSFVWKVLVIENVFITESAPSG